MAEGNSQQAALRRWWSKPPN